MNWSRELNLPWIGWMLDSMLRKEGNFWSEEFSSINESSLLISILMKSRIFARKADPRSSWSFSSVIGTIGVQFMDSWLLKDPFELDFGSKPLAMSDFGVIDVIETAFFGRDQMGSTISDSGFFPRLIKSDPWGLET